MTIKKIAVTGAAGQIAYSLLFRLAAGELFGKDQKISLHLLELPASLEALKGVVMELEDCAFTTLVEVRVGSDPYQVFEGVEYAFLVGAKPRGPGMERKDLLEENGKIFVEQGKALNACAAKDVIVLVVGNPCNTNCLIAKSQAPRLSRFYSMMRLDQNRATSFLARKADVEISSVSSVCIWGNHSATQVPDFVHARIGGKLAEEVILDRKWCEQEFCPEVQKRGAAVIAARGKSSAASAAHAALESMRSLVVPSATRDWFSVGSWSDGNPYGIAPGLIFSFPSRLVRPGEIEIVPDLEWDPFLRDKIRLSEKELIEERNCVFGG